MHYPSPRQPGQQPTTTNMVKNWFSNNGNAFTCKLPMKYDIWIIHWDDHLIKKAVCVFEWKYGRLNAAKCVVKLFTGNNDELQRMMAVECGKSWHEPNLSRWNEKKYSGKSFLFNAFPSGELYYIIWFTAHSFGIRVPLVMIRMERGKDRGFPSNVFVCDFFLSFFPYGLWQSHFSIFYKCCAFKIT